MLILEEFAQALDGRTYGHELTADDKTRARELGIVIVYGAYDDLCELEGALRDEIDCYEGRIAHLSQAGVIENTLQSKCFCGETDECPLAQEFVQQGNALHIYWCREDEDADGFMWSFKIDVPSAAFHIYEDGDRYCRGIVFFKSSLIKKEWAK